MFPIPVSYLRNNIYHQLGISSHSFRRTLAIQLGILLNSLGFDTKKKLNRILPAINIIGGWSAASEEFYHYSQDFLIHRNIGVFRFSEYINYIISYEIAQFGESIISTEKRQTIGEDSGSLLVPLCKLEASNKLATSGFQENKTNSSNNKDERLSSYPNKNIGATSVSFSAYGKKKGSFGKERGPKIKLEGPKRSRKKRTVTNIRKSELALK